MSRRLFGAFGAAALLLSLSASVAFAGEYTGNGKSLQVENSKWGTGLHARSLCAFSGQEDLQFEDEEGNPLETPTRGVPARAQSWGQIPKADREFLTSIGVNPGNACNPIRAAEAPPEEPAQ